MFRTYLLALLSVFLLMIGIPDVSAQGYQRNPEPRDREPRAGIDLDGRYIYTANGQPTEVIRRWNGYTFINDSGARARFDFIGPNRLTMTSGSWTPGIGATVDRGRDGRLRIWFDVSGQPAGMWVRQD
jgi:hypothetical protein